MLLEPDCLRSLSHKARGRHIFKRVSVLAGKTLTAPLDRVKLLLQTRGGLQAGALKEAARGGGVVGALVAIGKEEGFMGYWKGNVPQVRSQHRPRAMHSKSLCNCLSGREVCL